MSVDGDLSLPLLANLYLSHRACPGHSGLSKGQHLREVLTDMFGFGAGQMLQQFTGCNYDGDYMHKKVGYNLQIVYFFLLQRLFKN